MSNQNLRLAVFVGLVVVGYLFKGNIKATYNEIFDKTAVKDEGVKQ